MSLRVMKLFSLVDAIAGEAGASAAMMDRIMERIDDTRTAPRRATSAQVAHLSQMPMPRRFCRARMCRADRAIGPVALIAGAVSSACRAARRGP